MSKIIFLYNGLKTTIQCNEEESMKDNRPKI